MPHVIEPAASGRARCRGCGQPIARGELRFGERVANPFADGETTLWFHLRCAAYKRPQTLLETLAAPPTATEGAEPAPGPAAEERERLERAAHASLAHRRIPRIDGAERAPSAQARCRLCREPIARGSWRIRLVFFEEGRFTPGGNLHLDCRLAYFESTSDELVERILHFSPGLDAEERAALAQACASDPRPPPSPPAES